MRTEPPHVVIIGAGMAGLTAARELRTGLAEVRVTVLDKGRGVGGRMATRRIGEATIDHGAQFITTHSPEFAATVEAWAAAGVVEQWFDAQIGPFGTASSDGHPRYRGSVSMNAVAKHLAIGLDVVTSSRVAALAVQGDQWLVTMAEGAPIVADAVVTTAPVPQGLEVLGSGSTVLAPADARALEAIRYEPCLAALVPLDGPSGLPEPGAIAPNGGPIAWIADNQRKGISARPAVTIHPTGDFSRQRWDAPDQVVIDELLAAAGLQAGAEQGEAQVQRWRYSRPTRLHAEPTLVASGVPPLVFAGDAFGGAKVEGAARSGAAAADALMRLLAG